MKHKLILFLLLFLGTLISFPQMGQVSAATFNRNNVIDDGIFDNANSMNAAQIDSFLNSFSGSCISTNNGFSAIDPTGYNATDGFIYGGNVSAGNIISHASQAYGINPQVLLTTLQKEQSLVNGGAGCSTNRYAKAAGYGCPDSGGSYNYTGLNLYTKSGVTYHDVSGVCVNSAAKAGFTQQVIRAAWLLKYSQQRSKGNINWAVVKGSWNNSDDLNATYSGYMTEGCFKRSKYEASCTNYDGYITIDNTAVHLESGATAALYRYTPHFSGNQNFSTIFTNWFGSTMFPQPLGSKLLYQTSNGKIYLVTDTTRYYVPNWNMMTNYGLETYPTLASEDGEVQQYTDGGTLTNLTADSGGVYMVNGQTRYHVTPSMCTAWGLSCFDSTVVKSLGTAFQTQHLREGGEIPQLAASNGVIYKMFAGQKQPVANPRTLSDLGLSNLPILVTSALNSNYPLGSLLVTTPGVIQFSASSPLYYFDGSAYYLVYDMNSYFDWGLNKATSIDAPASSFSTTPPASTTLSTYANVGGSKYVVDQGRKLSVPTEAGALWPDSQFVTPPTTLFNSIPASTLSQNIYTDMGVFVLSGGQKHYVSSTDDFPGLNISSTNLSNVRSDKIKSVATGADALPDGKLILTTNDGKIYVVNNHKLTYVPGPSIFTAYGYDWGKIASYPGTIATDYPVDVNVLGAMKNPAGDAFIAFNGSLYKLPAALTRDFGIINSSLPSISNQAIKRANIPQLPRFLYNSDDGKIFYASGEAIHYVTSMNSYRAYGGLNSQPAAVDTQTINLFTVAQPI